MSHPEQTNCAKANLGTPAPIVTLSPTHSHTFPLSTQHPILSKDEERAEPRAPALRPPAQIKTANLPSFLSLSLDMFRGPIVPPAAFVVSCLSRPTIIIMTTTTTTTMMVMMTAMAAAAEAAQGEAAAEG